MTNLSVALDYAVGGAAVLPLHTPVPGGCSCRRRGCTAVGKHPRTMRGKDDASADLDTVTRWWTMWPGANVGIRPPEGTVVLDVDPRNGGDVQLAAMQDRYGPLPDTRAARTGSGGWHLWFCCPGPVRGELAPGIDIKSHTGYLVVPLSVHACGQIYEWTDTGAIVVAPEYLRRLLARPVVPVRPSTGRVTPAVVDGLVRVVAQAPEGGRNRALFWAAARAHERGIDVGPLVDAAAGAGLDAEEIARTVASAAKAPPLPAGGAR